MQTKLVTLLSWALVAFTIELDNEFEHRMVHRTTRQRHIGTGGSGPWLTSFAMYANCLQFLSETAIPVWDLERLARSGTNLDGMQRWGYTRLSPPPDKPGSKRPNKSWLVGLTRLGRDAQETWRPLPHLIEERWRDRFDADAMSSLRDVLLEANRASSVAFPDFLPILHYGLFTLGTERGRERTLPPASEAPLADDAPMTALLSRLVCGFAFDFERQFPVSLAISANLLRLLDASGVPYKELPQRAGISREAIGTAAGVLRKAGLVTIGSGVGKLIKLTVRGLEAQRDASRLMSEIEKSWQQTLSEETMRQLRHSLHRVADSQILFEGLQPYADSWLASVPMPRTLPHFPMVLHRGGYPDGS